MQVKSGRQMTEEKVKEWQQAFIDIEESIDAVTESKCVNEEYKKYMRLKQQDLF